MKRILLLLAALCILVIFALLPLPVPAYLDFQVIYQADMGLLHGIPVYDHAGQVKMIAQVANVAPEQVHILPFPYPPWYALALLPLALLPIQVAARIWFEINLLLLVLSIGLMTDGWPARKRIGTGLAAVFFLPVLGTLFVGQYIFPVLFGAVLWAHAVRRENSALAALASALLTFKPHLGAPILLAGLIHLFARRDAFSRRTFFWMSLFGIGLFMLGFYADGAWPPDYYHSLLAFRQDAGVSSCGLCASLPVALGNLFKSPARLASAPLIGLIIFISLAFWLGLSRPGTLKDSKTIITLSILVTLLSSPYLLNYDFVLLLMPFFLLAGRDHTPLDWSLILAAYLIPFIALGLWDRNGDLVFPISALTLFLLLYRDIRSLDGLPRAA